jgi:lipid II:glycine glycyltransferase (peptidoglycan interpeptide bridge formation enzyme)
VSSNELRLAAISAEEHAAFLASRKDVSFMQRPEWAQIKPAWRGLSLGWFSGDEQVGAALVLMRPAPVVRKSLAYLPDGPVIDFAQFSPESVLRTLSEHLKANGAFALRIGPSVNTTTWKAVDVRKAMGSGQLEDLSQLEHTKNSAAADAVTAALQSLGFNHLDSGMDFAAGQPEYVARVPLVDAESQPLTIDQVMAGFSQSARRETRQSLKAELDIVVGETSDMDRFHALYSTTADRQDFTGRPLEYFTNLHKTLNDAQPGSCSLYIASHEGRDLAAAIRLRSGNRSWYVYGASSNEQRKLNAPKALQHRMLSDALEEGCLYLDQGGVTPTLKRGDAHGGLSYFKTSMGCDIIRTVGEWELPLNRVLAWGFDKFMAWREKH